MIFEDYNPKQEIEKYKDLIKEQENEIDKKQIILNSLKDSLITIVRNIIPDYSDKMLYAAYWGQWNQEDDETNAKNKSMLKFLKTDIFERLFDKDKRKYVKFEKILRYGHDDYAYGFYFTYNEIKFELRIPVIKNAKIENVNYMNYGKYALYYEEKKSCWIHIKNSYSLDDIADVITDNSILLKMYAE